MQKAQDQVFSIQCEVKTKYMNKWEPRLISLNFPHNRLILAKKNQKDKKKQFSLDTVSFSFAKNQEEKGTKINQLIIPEGRTYEVKTNKQNAKALNFLNKYPKIKKMDEDMKEQTVVPIKNINYFAPLRTQSYNNDYETIRQSLKVISAKRLEDYERWSSYLKLNDWQRDIKKGGLLFINEQKKSNISKIVKYICKRVISSGSFMGVSFPTFAMKPQSMLETYCKCLGAAPLILKGISSDPVERIKAFNAILFTISVQFNDIDKPFNPVIGQTFQGQIGGYQVCAQQICHHPPISSFMLYGDGYVLHASLELNAQMSMNSAVGIFYGEVYLEFDDGGVVKGRMPSGLMTGLLFGETRFGPIGAAYSYDPKNHLICSYQTIQKDVMVGCIGKLKPKAQNNFFKVLETVQKYEKFKHIPERDFEKVNSRLELIWTNQLRYDNKSYWKYDEPENLPIKLSYNASNKLKSDSTFRKDIKLRGQNLMDESHELKQEIEEEERRVRKLRNANKKKQT